MGAGGGQLGRFPVIVGPTAGGKSGLAVDVARRLEEQGRRAEIVTADAFQIYRGMDIGTAKPTPEERGGVAHHLIDLIEPNGPEERGGGFTVYDWLERAEALIGALRGRGVTPIVVGGTHLYVKALLEGMMEGPGADEAVRAELRARPREELRAELERVDAEAARRIHANDLRRTVRALEVFRMTGRPLSAQQEQWDRAGRARADAVLIGLDWPTEEINRRINARVKEMVRRGLIEEVRDLRAAGKLGKQSGAALGYKQVAAALEACGGVTYGPRWERLREEAVEKVKIETRRFAKNQRTWLNRLRMIAGSVWIDTARTAREGWAERVVRAMEADDAGT